MLFRSKGIPTSSQKLGKKTILRNGDIIQTQWNSKTIKNIIKNTRYKGYRTYGGEIFSVPQIIDEKLWAEANKRLGEHIGYLCRTKYNYLAKGKIICGQCGYTLKSLRKYSKKKEDVLYYHCQSYLHTGQNCDCGRFRSEVFDKNLYSILMGHSKGLETLVGQGSLAKEKEELNKKIEYWNIEKDSAIKEKNRVLTLFKKGFIDESEMESDFGKINKKINESNTEILRLSNLLQKIEVPEESFIEVMKKYYWNSDFATRRTFVEKYIEKIKVYKVKIIDFDLNKISNIVYEDGGNNTISVVTKKGFQKPKKNEVLWYVEVFAFNKDIPIKIFMTSGTDTNYMSPDLEFDKINRILSLFSKKI